LPIDLEDVSKYPNLFAELVLRGWSDEDLEKLAGRNLVRVFREVEQVRVVLRVPCNIVFGATFQILIPLFTRKGHDYNSLLFMHLQVRDAMAAGGAMPLYDWVPDEDLPEEHGCRTDA
jgi:membrane dipeptidase